jgi:2-phospho-L-lactate guanylyltransferase (CobY/MobA/RfbA family)
MRSSLQTGLSAVDPEADTVLIVLADQPLVQTATLDELIAEYNRHKPQILIPTYRGFRGNPVLLDKSIVPEIAAAALTGDTGCPAIFGAHIENIRSFTGKRYRSFVGPGQPEDLVSSGMVLIQESWNPRCRRSVPLCGGRVIFKERESSVRYC